MICTHKCSNSVLLALLVLHVCGLAELVYLTTTTLTPARPPRPACCYCAARYGVSRLKLLCKIRPVGGGGGGRLFVYRVYGISCELLSAGAFFSSFLAWLWFFFQIVNWFWFVWYKFVKYKYFYKYWYKKVKIENFKILTYLKKKYC